MSASPAIRTKVAIGFSALLSLLILPVRPSSGQEPNKIPEAPHGIRVQVALVTLTATVVDSAGRPANSLEKEDFDVYEDGVQQKIAVFQSEDVPVSVGILFDTSGSMGDKIDEVKDAIIHFMDTINPQDDIFLMQFSTEAFLVQDFTGDRQRLRQAIGSLRARGSTALYEAIVKGLEYVQKGRHQKKALVVVTDGNDTSSDINFKQALDFALRSEVLVYCLGIGHGELGSFGHMEGLFKDTVDADALLAFSDSTAGKTFLLQGAHYKGGVDQIDQACQQVAAELRRQYTLGYYPSDWRMDGGYRQIRVDVKKGKFKVRTREGYFAPLEPAATSP